MSTETYTSRPYRALSFSAFIVGLAAVAWVASGFVGSSAFALGMTLLIGTVYLGGAWELRRFGQTTVALHSAMASVPQPLAQLADWLPSVPAPLRNAVRQRVEGERSAFPSLALTPYLIGLLVMLGMLGNFIASRRVSESSVLHAAATSLVYGLVEQVKQLDYANLLPNYETDPAAPNTLTPPYIRLRINQNTIKWIRVVHTSSTDEDATTTTAAAAAERSGY